jgi:hypothetical protein
VIVPTFSIITPSVERESLIACCKSVEAQHYDSWQHIVAVDKETLNPSLMGKIAHPQRTVLCCGQEYRNTGNTPRRLAWDLARGDYCYFLDDDNFLASDRTLFQIAKALKNTEEIWTLWPILRHGSIFFHDPPAPCLFDTGNAVVRREYAQWPDTDGYAADAVWLEGLLKYPYKAFPEAMPIMQMDKTSFGEGGGMNGE